MYLDSDRKPPITPQLAIRIAIIGGAALVMFGIIFFRLWYMQVLSGDRYLAEANNNRVREINVEAPRGKIVDRNGRLLVGNRTGYEVQISPDKFPKDAVEQQRVYARLAHLLGMRRKTIEREVQKQFKVLPFSAATVKQDVPQPVLAYVLENNDRFPGVQVEQVALRLYPGHDVGAHLFGTVGQITKDELKDKRYRGVKQGDRVGQSGIEYSYDRYLRGVDGATRLQVDARGTLRGELAVKNPKPGQQLRLGVDLDVEKTAQQAMGGAKGGFVVMDVDTGEVRALGSSPSFDPNIFSKVIKESDYKRLSDPNQGAPLSNRAIQGLYPTGSTFKLITATAALQGGLISPLTTLYDPGYFKVGGVTFKNAEGAANGPLQLRKALQVSDDVFFYQLGLQAYNKGDGQLIQRWARRYGLGSDSGIDLPSESPGLIAGPKAKKMLYKAKVADTPQWYPGDNVNFSVGQGFLQVTPLQLAVAYAAF